VDHEIELAEPNFIALAPEEAAEAVHLLAALIRALPPRSSDSPVSSPGRSSRPNDRVGGARPARGSSGEARLAEGAP
jgi:hypothetical protein